MNGPPRSCRMCERTADVRPVTRHHVVPQWWFRDQRARGFHVPPASSHSNIVPLCRPCHDLIDHGPTRWKLIYRAMLRRRLYDREVAFAIRVRGSQWVDAHYPPPRLSHSAKDSLIRR